MDSEDQSLEGPCRSFPRRRKHRLSSGHLPPRPSPLSGGCGQGGRRPGSQKGKLSAWEGRGDKASRHRVKCFQEGAVHPSLPTLPFPSICEVVSLYLGFPVSTLVENPPANAGDAGAVGSVPGWGRSPGEWSGNPLQCSCLENPMDGGAWQATVSPWGHKELDMTGHTCIFFVLNELML